jgi:hypothetical protein
MRMGGETLMRQNKAKGKLMATLYWLHKIPERTFTGPHESSAAATAQRDGFLAHDRRVAAPIATGPGGGGARINASDYEVIAVTA